MAKFKTKKVIKNLDTRTKLSKMNNTLNDTVRKLKTQLKQKDIEIAKLKQTAKEVEQDNKTKMIMINTMRTENVKKTQEITNLRRENETETIQIESKAMKYIIGKRGANIHRIQRETETKIQAQPRNETQKQRIEIKGKHEHVKKARQQIIEATTRLKQCQQTNNGECNHKACEYAHKPPPYWR